MQLGITLVNDRNVILAETEISRNRKYYIVPAETETEISASVQPKPKPKPKFCYLGNKTNLNKSHIFGKFFHQMTGFLLQKEEF